MNVLPLSAMVFVAAHLLISGTPLRGLLVRRIGEGPYRGVFSLIALGTLIWLIRAYNAATPEPLWAVTALGWAPLALMPFALMSLVIGVTSPNPSLAGMEGRFRGEIQALGIFRDPPSRADGHRPVGPGPPAGQRRHGVHLVFRRHAGPGRGGGGFPGPQEGQG